MLKKLTKQFCQLLERRKEKGERRNSHAEKGDCEADERKRIKERPSGLVTLKPHNLMTSKPHLITLKKIKTPQATMLVGFSFFVCKFFLVCLNSNALFLDTCLLTCEVTEVVELSAAYLTNLVHFDALDSGRFEGEDTFNTYST